MRVALAGMWQSRWHKQRPVWSHRLGISSCRINLVPGRAQACYQMACAYLMSAVNWHISAWCEHDGMRANTHSYSLQYWFPTVLARSSRRWGWCPCLGHSCQEPLVVPVLRSQQSCMTGSYTVLPFTVFAATREGHESEQCCGDVAVSADGRLQ